MRAKMVREGRPLLRENLAFKNDDFSSIFARSASSVTPSEKSFITITRIGSAVKRTRQIIDS